MADKKKNNVHTIFKTAGYFFPIVWRTHKGFFFLCVLRTILAAAQPFVKIMLLPLIIDELLGSRDIQALLLYAAALVLGQNLLSFARSFTDTTLEKYDYLFQNEFTEIMSRRIMELDFQLTEDKTALDQIELAREGMSWYSGGVYGITMQFFYLAANVLIVVGTVVLIAMNAPLLFVITAVLLAGHAVIQSIVNKIEIESFSKLSKFNRIFGYLGYGLMEVRYGKDIRLYHAKDMMVDKWEEYTDNSLKNWKWQADKRLPMFLLKTLLSVAYDAAQYLYLGIRVIGGKITIGMFSQMLSAGSTFNESLQGIVGNIQEIIKRSKYAYEYVKFMEYPAAIQKGSRPVNKGPHTLEFRNVSFAYPKSETKVLDRINLTLHQGEHLSVVGPNGAGKTTFVKLLCRLYDPTEGEILLDGVDIREYEYTEYMSLFSPVFQDFKLFGFSIRDNVALNSACSDEEMAKLMGQVGLSDKITSLKNGTDTMLFKSFDEEGIEPSGGEQQKIAIARALFKKAPVVILDEPTAALDPVAEYEIYRRFDELVGGKSAIYISHRLSSCKFCDRIAVFSQGGIREYGTHDELVSMTGGIYAEMYAAQAQYYQ
ncbi:MAG: ABC transporter ATP-binding protein/permease [Acetatifactor sp.]|nr:ABC transporter ATP-binding protein/permease [Acetatifactor sp.]